MEKIMTSIIGRTSTDLIPVVQKRDKPGWFGIHTSVLLSIFFLLPIAGSTLQLDCRIHASAYGASSQSKAVSSNASHETMLGQNLVIGIPGKTLDKKTRQIIQFINPAGIILYHRNFKTPVQLKTLIDELKQQPLANSPYDYFIMIDEEPGGASRLGLFKNIFDFGMPEWDSIESDIKEMARIGINVDLAPLADFPFNKDSFVRRRIQAHTIEALVEFNERFIALLGKHDIFATLKHFPGMGVFVDDPHRTLPSGRMDNQIVEDSLRIFSHGIRDGADFVMTGHAVYDDIDPEKPATLSRRIANGILRDELGFSGLVITDDLSDMPFIMGKDYDLTLAAAESLKAGHTLILFSHKLKKTRRIFLELLAQMRQDDELRSTVEENYMRVVTFKRRHALIADH